jgi:hypothetical protein
VFLFEYFSKVKMEDYYDDYGNDYGQPPLRNPSNSVMNGYDGMRVRRGAAAAAGAYFHDDTYGYSTRSPRAFMRDISLYEPHQTVMYQPEVYNPPVPARVDYHVQPVVHPVVTPKVNTYVRNHVTKVIQPVVQHVVTPQVNHVVSHHVQPVRLLFSSSRLHFAHLLYWVPCLQFSRVFENSW